MEVHYRHLERRSDGTALSLSWLSTPTPNPRLQRTRSALLRSPLSRKPLGRPKTAMAVLTSALVAFACQNQEVKPAHVIVRNPNYLVVRPISRVADAEHITRVDLPYSGAGYGFASSSALL